MQTLTDYKDVLSGLEPYLVKPATYGTAASDLFYTLVEQIHSIRGAALPARKQPGDDERPLATMSCRMTKSALEVCSARDPPLLA